MNLPRHCPRRNLGAIHPHQQILTLHTDESDKYHRIIHICVKQIRDNIQTRPRGLPPAPLSVRSNVDTSTPGQHSCVRPSPFSLPPSLPRAQALFKGILALALRVRSQVCASKHTCTHVCVRAHTHTPCGGARGSIRVRG